MAIRLREMRAALFVVVSLCCGLLPAAAQDYFKGKSITLYAGFTPGGGVDNEMRLVAQYFGRFVRGEPNILPMNMPGAGGILLGNYLYSIAKPDGLTIGMPGRSGFVLAGAIGDKNVKYDLPKFTFIGSSAPSDDMIWLRKDLNIKTYDQLRTSKQTIVLGGLAATSSTVALPTVLAKYENLPIKVISGFTGLNEVSLAMERGEVDGIYTHASTLRPDLVTSGAFVPIAQSFPIEPGIVVITEIAKNPREKALLNLLLAPSRLGAPVLAPPGLPPEVAKELRDAYVAMASSEDYQRDAAKRDIEVGKPSSGADLQAYVEGALSKVDPDVIAEFVSLTTGK
ncbi:MAG TPA: hypothetical protein VG271_13050 [Beijerinckiaceae bacterium]|nr:hypothetical protein [Beijerinckiaceae bacterium]